jgi:hypothetical protein
MRNENLNCKGVSYEDLLAELADTTILRRVKGLDLRQVAELTGNAYNAQRELEEAFAAFKREYWEHGQNNIGQGHKRGAVAGFDAGTEADLYGGTRSGVSGSEGGDDHPLGEGWRVRDEDWGGMAVPAGGAVLKGTIARDEKTRSEGGE